MPQDTNQNQTHRGSKPHDAAEESRLEAKESGGKRSRYVWAVFAINLVACAILVFLYIGTLGLKATLEKSYLIAPWLVMLGVISAPLLWQINFHGKQVVAAKDRRGRFQALGMGAKYEDALTSNEGVVTDVSTTVEDSSPIEDVTSTVRAKGEVET